MGVIFAASGLAAVGAFILGFMPVETAIIIYALIGATLGGLFSGTAGFAQYGIYSVAVGAIAGVIVGQVLPPLIVDANMNSIMVWLIPFTVKAAMIWAAAAGLAQKLRTG